MTTTVYYIVCTLLSLVILFGIHLMSKVKTAKQGNLLSAGATLLAIITTLIYFEIYTTRDVFGIILVLIAVGAILGLILASHVKMIQMPQMVALLNGLGGGASAIVGASTLFTESTRFELVTAIIALFIGAVTLTGSLMAAGKLSGKINGRPKVLPYHQAITLLNFTAIVLLCIPAFVDTAHLTWVMILITVLSALLGVIITLRIGGADMPIAISLLNSFSGVAGSIAGMAIGDILLVSVGGIVGASGLILTQIMCRAMNRSLLDILLGKTSIAHKKEVKKEITKQQESEVEEEKKEVNLSHLLQQAKKIIIVPGYGMALAQAQYLLKQMATLFETSGAEVKFAIHPVAGRMPGHMNVLLAEADVDYDQLYEMESVNNEFKEADLCLVVGANDVINPAARNAEGTPIYGMPVLNVDEARHVIICNFDLKPGYAGVENPLYHRRDGLTLLLGDAKESLTTLIDTFNKKEEVVEKKEAQDLEDLLSEAKRVIIVPGYGMALAQAQHLIKQLSDRFEQKGAQVKYAIHPVAGRMPGHMNVLLAEANVDYDQLYEMEAVNEEFKDTDLCIVIGANDVINPAAREAEGTPIYGMPVLNVDQAKHIIICNYDLKPGYAGVENPIYTWKEGVTLLLGDAKASLTELLQKLNREAKSPGKEETEEERLQHLIENAKKVIIVPGYGMALAQAQHLIKQLSDRFEQRGAGVKFAIHPVAGRMPGHMNVLLAEADVDYDQLYEMEMVNEEFKETDLTIVVGANDVINPAARDAEGTPIYGMPVLNVDQSKHIVICNYDLMPGYAGVDNPLYEKKEDVTLLLGDAKESLAKLLNLF